MNRHGDGCGCMRCRRRERREERLLERSVRAPRQSLEGRAQEAVIQVPSLVPGQLFSPALPREEEAIPNLSILTSAQASFADVLHTHSIVAAPCPVAAAPKAPAPPAKAISFIRAGEVCEYGDDWSFERMLGRTEEELWGLIAVCESWLRAADRDGEKDAFHEEMKAGCLEEISRLRDGGLPEKHPHLLLADSFQNIDVLLRQPLSEAK